MNIKLKELGWSNMFSYGENNVLDLTKNTITQVVADNGTGKTALVLIIQEILFSKNMKDIKKGDIVNRYSGSDKWSAYLLLDIDGDEYKVVVARKGATSKVSLSKNGKDMSEHKIPDTYKKIVSYLGGTFEVMTQLMYQSSNSQLEFLRATDTNRKKFLVSLFNLSSYLTHGETLKNAITKYERELSTLEGEQKAVTDFLAQNSNITEKKKLIEVPVVSDQLRNEIRDLEVRIASYTDLCKKIDKNNLINDERLKLQFKVDLQKPDTERIKQLSSLINELEPKIKYHEADVKKLQVKIKSLDTATHCPTCKQPIDNSHSIQMAAQLEAEIKTCKDFIAENSPVVIKYSEEFVKLSNEQNAFNVNAQRMERFEQLSQAWDESLPNVYPNNTEDKSVLQAKKSELENQIKSQADATKYNNDVNIFNGKVEIIVNQKREFLARQELISSDIINLQSKLDRLATLRKTFSPAGVVAYKLENIIKEFENEINKYLVELSDGQFQINFRLEGEKLNIIVFSNGVESPIENASEGEFSRIQTATLLAIRKLLSGMDGIQINFLFLDEVMGVLDKSGKERLIEILQQEEGTNTFLVAHDFSHPLVPQLKITKENNIARIVA